MNNAVARFIAKAKRIFIKSKSKVEVWDYSAVCAYLERIQSRIKADNNIKIVVPEVVVNLLSEAKDNNIYLMRIYDYLMQCESNKLCFAVTDRQYRTLSPERQTLTIVEEYYRQGQDVTLVTCDIRQTMIADQNRFNYIYFGTTPISNSEKKTDDIQKAWSMQMLNPKHKNTHNLPANKKTERYTVIEKLNYIYVRPGITVLDSRGKRRIGKNNRVQVAIMDRVVYNDENEYKVVDFDGKYVILEKI